MNFKRYKLLIFETTVIAAFLCRFAYYTTILISACSRINGECTNCHKPAVYNLFFLMTTESASGWRVFCACVRGVRGRQARI